LTHDTIRARGRRGTSPLVAAFLSFLWPGLGHWYLGRPRIAALLAAPIAILVLVLIAWLSRGVTKVVVDLLSPEVSVTLTVLVLAAGAWRLGSIVHAAWMSAGSRGFRRPAVASCLAVLAVIVITTHVWAAAVSWSVYRASEDVFSPGRDQPPPVAVGPSGSPSGSAEPTPSDPFLATPEATPPDVDSRVNVLITGIDAGENRRTTLTDTLIVVSFDPKSGKAAMISFPRDIARFEMSNGRIYTGKINSLMTFANNHPVDYPKGGLPTLMRELGHILGVPIHYYAAVDLDGFRKLIDATGGITVDNPKAINDPTFGWSDGRVGFQLSAGRHRLDGETALAYVRTRKGVGDNDFTRARRQQLVLLALREQLTDPAMLPKLPDLIRIGSSTVRTNFPRGRVGEMLDLAGSMQDDEENMQRVVLGPPYARNPPAGTPGGYQLILDMDRISELSIKLFGDDSRYAE
jgi:LCP family protein required for cell wall assembly